MSARDVIAPIVGACACDGLCGTTHPLLCAGCELMGFERADAILAALDAAGKVVVDKEPTPAMVHAAPGRPNQATEDSMYHGIWRAMLAAAVEAADA